MSKKLLLFAMGELILSAILLSLGLPKNKVTYYETSDIVRVHIVANSNSGEDMSVKSDIRDYLIQRLSDMDFSSSEETVSYVNENCVDIQKDIDSMLVSGGFSYGAKVTSGTEAFPVRLYGDVLTESGNYNTVRVVLGEGNGDNWWCVAYPSLCLNKEKKKASFKSRIVEWWNSLWN